MKIWRIAEKLKTSYAQAWRHGAWTEGKLCDECGTSSESRKKPLILEWAYGSNRIGDFVWPGGSEECAVSERIQPIFHQLADVCFGAVEMTQDERTPRRKAQARPRVWLPYEGPPIHELWINTHIHAERNKSTLYTQHKCHTCGSTAFRLDGAELEEPKWDPSRGELELVRIPRTPGKGVFVRRHDLGGNHVFRIKELPAAILCTNEFKQELQKHNATNWDSFEYGETI